MKNTSIIAAVLVLFIAAEAAAFDKNRSGFALGFSLGYAPYVRTEVDALNHSETDSPFSFGFLIGHGLSDRDLILVEWTGAYYDSDLSLERDNIVRFSMWGGRWYHYWGDGPRAPFTSVSLSRMTFDRECCEELPAWGWGITLGGGYEFVQQIQAGMYYHIGITSDDDFDYDHQMLQVMITVVAY